MATTLESIAWLLALVSIWLYGKATSYNKFIRISGPLFGVFCTLIFIYVFSFGEFQSIPIAANTCFMLLHIFNMKKFARAL